jgi:serine/threonine protein kinase
MLDPNTHLKDRYRILEKIGRGGFGTVYKAVDEVLSCTVAIKEIREGFGQQEKFKKAFEREAKLLRNLKHECLPRVTDYFSHDNSLFLVMDFIEGDDFAVLLKSRLTSRGPFTVSELLPFADRVLSALEYLHTLPEPIIHRDLKPANIKLGTDGCIYLLDFGLAKGAAGQMSTIRDGDSSINVSWGTPPYAPLEQVQDTGSQPQSDIYGFGATIYHLLTGQVPIPAAQRDEIIQRGLADPLKPAHEVNPTIPVAISQLIERAMTIRWWDRLASAKEMRVALSNAAGDLTDTQPQPLGGVTPLGPASTEKARPQPPTAVRAKFDTSTNSTDAIAGSGRVSRRVIIGSLAAVLIAVFAVGSWWAAKRFQWFTRAETSVAGFRLMPALTEHKAIVWAIAFSHDGRKAASGDNDGRIILWDTSANPWIPTFLIGPEIPVYSVAFSRDGTILASAGNDRAITLWDVRDVRKGTRISSLEDGPKSIFRVAFNPDASAGNLIASISGSDPRVGGDEIRLWRRERDDWRPTRLAYTSGGNLYAVAFSPDGKILAGAGDGTKIIFWDLTNSTQRTELSIDQPANEFVNELIFSPDGKYLAAGSSDGSIRLWRRTEAWVQEPQISNEHGRVITALAFSPDSTTIVSASGIRNRTIRRRNILTGISERLTTDSDTVSLALAFSPDGKTLVSGGQDGRISIWQVGTDQ